MLQVRLAFFFISNIISLFSIRYQALAISSGTDPNSSNPNDARRKGIDADPSLSLSQSSSKRVSPEWSFVLGEGALNIQLTQRVRQTSQTILVLGERNLFGLSDTGQLLFLKKFEYNPSSFVIYTHDNALNSKMKKNRGRKIQ